MSYFLCLAVPQKVADQLPLVFDKRIYQTDASNLPIGKTTRGKNYSWAATLLQIGFSSASLIGKAAVKKTHNNDHTELLLSGLQALFEMEEYLNVAFLVHWMHGHITTEEILLRGEESVDISGLPQLVLRIEEDMRYIICKQTL